MSTTKMTGYRRKFPGSQHGLVSVELAITLPLIILIMLATAEFGRAFYQYTTLTKAVEAGTRYYASTVLDTTIPDATKETTTENLVVFGSPQSGGDRVLPDFGGGNGGVAVPVLVLDHVIVSAQYNFVPLIAGIPIFGSAAVTMTATNTMRASGT